MIFQIVEIQAQSDPGSIVVESGVVIGHEETIDGTHGVLDGVGSDGVQSIDGCFVGCFGVWFFGRRSVCLRPQRRYRQ